MFLGKVYLRFWRRNLGHPGSGSTALSRALPVALALFFFAPAVEAVTFVEQAERLALIYAFLLDYRPARPPAGAAAPTLELSVELIPVPSIDNRVGAKEEPIDSPPFIPRLRGRGFFDSGMMIGLTYNPPVEVEGYTATWFGVETGYRFALAPLLLELRGFFLSAEIEGPITEPDSSDLFEFSNMGADLRAGYPWGAFRFYGGVGRGRTSTRQTVVADGARIEAGGGYTYLLAGLGLEGDAFAFTLEQSRTENFLSHFVLAASYRF